MGWGHFFIYSYMSSTKPSKIFFFGTMRPRAYIYQYVAMFSGPLHKSSQPSVIGLQTGLLPTGIISLALIDLSMGINFKNLDSLKPCCSHRAYICILWVRDVIQNDLSTSPTYNPVPYHAPGFGPNWPRPLLKIDCRRCVHKSSQKSSGGLCKTMRPRAFRDGVVDVARAYSVSST